MSPAYPSFFFAGFECATQVLRTGRRLDLASSTGHLLHAKGDYAVTAAHGMRVARDGFRWPFIEARPGQYEWESAAALIRAADHAQVQVIWDLCHYGIPDWLEIMAPSFIDSFARYVRAAARLLREESDMPSRFCPINEISFWAWGGGDVGYLNPFWTDRGNELKRQLVRASLAAIAEIRAVDSGAEIVSAEPLIYVAPADQSSPESIAAAAGYDNSQHAAVDMLLGRLCPELGGAEDAVDVVGLNYYPGNQWILDKGKIPLGDHGYQPLSDLLAASAERWRRPLLIAETGAEGTARAPWLHYVCQEVRAAQARGAQIGGVCLYPVLDYPGWDNDRHCHVGLFGSPDQSGHRHICPELAAELWRQQVMFPHRRLADSSLASLAC